MVGTIPIYRTFYQKNEQITKMLPFHIKISRIFAAYEKNKKFLCNCSY